ncbi:MAG TPA: hypothetical protein VG248_17975 [Caulobacteraceae bacterium]|jgi:putative transposase|nr:hypothetical protein [Caulobacteraceae bacterium]
MFQSRFASVVMDEEHLPAAACYVSMNPVRARLVARAQAWPWSSTRAHLAGRDDELVTIAPLLERFGDFAALLAGPDEAGADAALRAAETTGRPLGNEDFIRRLERLMGRKLARGRPAPKPKDRSPVEQMVLSG